MDKVAIVVINWNAPEDTIHCLEQLNEWHTLNPTIWVTDNGSADDSVMQIRSFIETISCTVHIIENNENQGFGGGSNRGIEAALADDMTYIFLFNNDAALSEEDAVLLIQALENDPTIGIIAPLIYDTQTPPQLYSAGNRNSVLSHQIRRKTIDRNTILLDVANVSGTAVAIRSKLFTDLGLLDEQYFFGMEFSDFCYRVSQSGFRCVVHNKTKAYHHIERSSHSRQTLHMYYTIRNRFIFIRNFYLFWKPVLFSFWMIYSVLLWGKLWLIGQRLSASATILGLMDGVRGRFGRQNERVVAYLRQE